MIQEANAKEIEDFALIPVGRAIDGHGGIDFRIFAGDARFDADALLPSIECT